MNWTRASPSRIINNFLIKINKLQLFQHPFSSYYTPDRILLLKNRDQYVGAKLLLNVIMINVEFTKSN